MPLWVKIGLGVFLSLIVFLICIFCLALWMMKVPDLEVSRDDPEASQKLENWLDALHAGRISKFNGTVLVRRGEDVLIRKAYGTDGQDRPLNMETPLRLASVSKQFTAVGVLTLVQAGRVDLEAPISDYFPNCPFTASVGSLLNNTSGIPDDIYHLAETDVLLTLEGVETLMCSGDIQQGDREFVYSNTGYLLAARLIERVTGQSFEAYMQAAVFDPLEMKNSRVWNLVSTEPFPDRGTGFQMSRKGKRAHEVTLLDGVAGDGGVFSTVTDLENWDRFWSDDRLLSKDLKQLALAPGENKYGFGWVRDGDLAWHNGSWLGARTYYSRNLRTGDLVILLENGSSPVVDNIANKIEMFLSE
jgi:CubicO group peptidase (beta-lactamase class C family)